ncbi:MAG: hypothetical protein D4R65_10290 [Verrucomicrobiaceae bacterium]|nr:MAG: hypothetical protein D4R65_10290 [Verrucomicrobiaceae bacterium]
MIIINGISPNGKRAITMHGEGVCDYLTNLLIGEAEVMSFKAGIHRLSANAVLDFCFSSIA